MTFDAANVALPQRISLVAQTIEAIEARMASSTWPAGLPSERLLCQEFQISRPTLREALKEMLRRKRLRRSGRKLIATTQSSPVESPRPRYQAIGLIFPGKLAEAAPRALVMIEKLRSSLQGIGLGLICIECPQAFLPKPDGALRRLTAQHKVDLWIAWGSKPEMQQWLIKRPEPLIVLGSTRFEGVFHSVEINFNALGHHAGKHLLRRGHRHLAIVMPRNPFDGDLDTLAGLQGAIKEAEGIKLTILEHEADIAPLCSSLNQLLSHRSRPSCLFVFQALTALSVMTHLMSMGWSIGKDVAIVCRDDDPCLHHVLPKMTRYSIREDVYVSRLVRLIRTHYQSKNPQPSRVCFLPNLIVGDSG